MEVTPMAGSPASLYSPLAYSQSLDPVIAGIVAMMAIANLQYAWTLFTKPIQASPARHFGRRCRSHSSYSSPWKPGSCPSKASWWIMIGPRFMLGIGSIMVGLGWIGSGRAETINGLYFWYGVGGIGAGIVYGGCHRERPEMVSRPPRTLRRPDCPAAFGIGTAATVAPIAENARRSLATSTRSFSGASSRASSCSLAAIFSGSHR